MKKTHTTFRFTFEKLDFPYFIYIGSKHHKQFIFFLFFIEIDIYWGYKDWMVKSPELLYGKYETWTRNPEYEDEEYDTFVFPPIDGKTTMGKL